MVCVTMPIGCEKRIASSTKMQASTIEKTCQLSITKIACAPVSGLRFSLTSFLNQKIRHFEHLIEAIRAAAVYPVFSVDDYRRNA